MGSTQQLIVPAILEADRKAVENRIAQIRDHVSLVQIDITNNTYTSGYSWPCNSTLAGGTDTDITLGTWPARELDLLVDSPAHHIPLIQTLAPQRVILHTTDSTHIDSVRRQIDQDCELYIGLLPTDSAAVLEPLYEHIDGVQCMGITEIGKQGQVFSSAVLPLIESITKRFTDLPVSVDGGVDEATITQLAQAGATRFAVGSAVWTGEPVENIKKLESLIQ